MKKQKQEVILTPYATLLVKPTDTDDVIRHEYHALARKQHPDLRNDKEPGPRWQEVNEAYPLVETVSRRTAWAKAHAMKSGGCTKCVGSGVVGSRVAGGKIKVCVTCKGVGRG